MGELQHGTYDDCKDLTEEEVIFFHNFYKNGEIHSDDEDPKQSDNEDDSLHDRYSEDYSTSSMDVNEPEDTEDIVDLDHEFSTAVCCL